MSTRPSPWALAYFFISAAIATVALPATGQVTASMARAAGLEVALASTRDVYLVVDAGSRRLSIRVRGVSLESFPIDSFVATERRPWWSDPRRDPVMLPRLFRTIATAGLIERKVVVPPTLKPWVAGADTGHNPPSDDSLLPPPPTYDVALDGGWTLEVRQDPRQGSSMDRFAAAVADGGRHLLGRGRADHRPVLRLAMNPAHAKKLYHLFRKGTAILVVGE